MDEIFFRFPHIGKQIFDKTDNKSFGNCREVAKSWNTFLKNEQQSFRIVNIYANLPGLEFIKTNDKKNSKKMPWRNSTKF